MNDLKINNYFSCICSNPCHTMMSSKMQSIKIIALQSHVSPEQRSGFGNKREGIAWNANRWRSIWALTTKPLSPVVLRAVGSLYGRQDSAVSSPTTPLELRERTQCKRCWYRWRLRGDYTASVRCFKRCHCVSTVLQQRFCGAFTGSCIFDCVFTAILRSCHGNHCSPKALLPASIRICLLFGKQNNNWSQYTHFELRELAVNSESAI